MNMFNKFGLGPKKQQKVPFKGEKLKKEEEVYSLKKNPYIRWIIFGVFILISILSLPRSEVRSTTNYTTGQPWRADDLTAPFTFAINKSQAEFDHGRCVESTMDWNVGERPRSRAQTEQRRMVWVGRQGL